MRLLAGDSLIIVLRDSNFIGGSGNITSGTFTDSQVVSVSGSQNTATVYVSDSSVALDPWGTWIKNWPG
jgi:hypothetical protein